MKNNIIKNTDYAFCIVHFGNNKKYLEYEIYTILMLKKNTKYDIVYLYSVNDTPIEFVNIIKSLDIIVKEYNDLNITYNIQNFNSQYKHFNTLRTCNYLFALKLTNYKKICIIESDMIIMNNIDNIFNLNSPTILYYLDKENIYENNKINKTNEELFNLSINKGFVNGGVLLFKPSLYYYKKSIKNLKLIIDNNCIYPNESLFLYTMKNLYNLPIKYNLSHYYINQYINKKKDIIIYHFNNTLYKPLDIIKDDYIYKNKKKNRKGIVIFFKKNYYDIYKNFVENKINQLD
jgi:hypothetical protein